LDWRALTDSHLFPHQPIDTGSLRGIFGHIVYHNLQATCRHLAHQTDPQRNSLGQVVKVWRITYRFGDRFAHPGNQMQATALISALQTTWTVLAAISFVDEPDLETGDIRSLDSSLHKFVQQPI
jgi:hypothetical protein